ncbi:DNA-binding response OmpR family regulator [Lachnospiraceae bacterium PF1-22]|uniref:response regulator transcription factor n=1 Tax=Ohessyouella blattaphilus TaxID=2949333 RepID=UPI003E264345
MSHKIMIVDDEPEIVSMLKQCLSLNGYEVTTAQNGEEALNRLQFQPDLILLDVNMPGMSGLSLCKQIRDYVSCPILFLTAAVEDRDKLQGFAAGGDDYITKPFSIDELGARVSAHLRREQRRQMAASVHFGNDTVIDYAGRTVIYKEQPIPLLNKEFDIIEVLSQNVGQVFDKEHLYEAAWGLDGQGNNSVVVEHIRKIRAKFTAAGARQMIETVWGAGYKWIK